MANKTRKGYLSHFPEHWEVYRMDEILDRLKNKVEVKNEESYKQIGIRSHGKGIFYKESVTGEELGNKSVFWIESDCFIVNIVFAWEMAVAKTTTADVGLIASHRFPMYKPKPDLLDLDFLLYYFKMPLGKHLLGLASPGGAGRNKTLGQKEFAELEICIPPVNEQKEIVSIISTWDKAISLKGNLIKEKKLYKEGLMQMLLNGEKRLEGFDKKWKEVRLENIAEIIMGQSPDSKEYTFENQGKYLIQGNADIKNRKSAPRMYTKVTTKECVKGDILMTVRAPVGAIADSLHNACIGRGVCAIRPKRVNKKFLFQLLISFESKWYKLEQGSTFTAVNSNDIKQLMLSIPQIEEQETIANILSEADNEIFLLDNELKETIEQKRGLIQQLFTGKNNIN